MNNAASTAQDEVVKTVTKAGAGGGIAIAALLIGAWFVYSNWGTLSEASRKLTAVDNNTEAVEELMNFYRVEYPQDNLTRTSEQSAELAETYARITSLENSRHDSEGVVERLETRVSENSQWRVEQERRATIRIQEHTKRDERDTRIEDRVEENKAINEKRFTRIEEYIERQKTDRQDVDIQAVRNEIDAMTNMIMLLQDTVERVSRAQYGNP